MRRWWRHSQNPDDDLLRDGLIKRFEFTFEMSIRTVKRYMKTEENIPPEGDLGYRSAIRAAGQLRLIDSVEDWLIYNAGPPRYQPRLRRRESSRRVSRGAAIPGRCSAIVESAQRGRR